VDEPHWDAKAKAQASLLLMAIVAIHACVALSTKFYFFQCVPLTALHSNETASHKDSIRQHRDSIT
jgi:hypothetical protein